jgi:hypothetical protein
VDRRSKRAKSSHAVLLSRQSSANEIVADYEKRLSLTLPRQTPEEGAIESDSRVSATLSRAESVLKAIGSLYLIDGIRPNWASSPPL